MMHRDLSAAWRRSCSSWESSRAGTSNTRRSFIPIALATIAWGAVIYSGVLWLWSYSTTPGAAKAHPVDWPEQSRIVRAVAGNTLLMFLHPLCPCSRASKAELNRLVNDNHGRDLKVVVVLHPAVADGERTHWPSTQRSSPLEIPNSFVDWGGDEAARFGALTSGQVLLYDPAGHLQFAGGITRGRGQEGPNAGIETLRTALRCRQVKVDREAAADVSPTFGCPLTESNE